MPSSSFPRFSFDSFPLYFFYSPFPLHASTLPFICFIVPSGYILVSIGLVSQAALLVSVCMNLSFIIPFLHFSWLFSSFLLFAASPQHFVWLWRCFVTYIEKIFFLISFSSKLLIQYNLTFCKYIVSSRNGQLIPESDINRLQLTSGMFYLFLLFKSFSIYLLKLYLHMYIYILLLKCAFITAGRIFNENLTRVFKCRRELQRDGATMHEGILMLR